MTDVIDLPENVNDFTSILILDDKDKVPEIKGISIKQLLYTNVYIASGPLVLINKIYPELKIRL